MAASKGLLFQIKKSGNVICSGIASKKIKYNGEPIEITSDDDTGYRTFLAETGTKSLDVSIEGVAKDTVLRDLILTDARMLTGVSLNFSNGDTITGDFFLASFDEDYQHDDAVKFSAELQSSGIYTFVNAP